MGESHPKIVIDAVFNNYSYPTDFSEPWEHRTVVNTGPQEISHGQSYKWVASNRCEINFSYKDKTVRISHEHGIYSDEPLVGAAHIYAGGVYHTVKLNNVQRRLRPLSSDWKKLMVDNHHSPSEVEKLNGLAGKLGSSENSIVLGFDRDYDNVWTDMYVRMPTQKVSRGCRVKVSFDYLIDKTSVNPLMFETVLWEYHPKLPEKVNYNESILPLKKDNYWYKFTKTIKVSRYSDEIAFTFRFKQDKKRGMVRGFALVDNFKLEVLGDKFTP